MNNTRVCQSVLIDGRHLTVLTFLRGEELTPHYIQATMRDEHHNTVSWYDSNGNYEKFDVTIDGYDKSGNPKFKFTYIDSTTVLYLNGVKYPNTQLFNAAKAIKRDYNK